MDEEIWLRYPHNELYAVSTWGRIVKLRSTERSPKRLICIKCPANGNPLFCSVLSSYVGVIVLETFVEPKPLGMTVGYKDGNNQNNHLENLYWKSRYKDENTISQSS